MKSVLELFNLEPGEKISKGKAVLSSYELKKDIGLSLHNLRAIRDGGSFMALHPGKYVRLHIDDVLMMSDTHMERITNENFVDHANGKVLIGGLGVGLIIYNLMGKLKDGIVTNITVIEKSQDNINLIGPYFKHQNIKIINDDIFTWQPKKGEKFDTIYFDIWPEISTDNLADMKRLHNRFKYKLNRENSNRFMDSWLKDYLQKKRRKELVEDKHWC
jgi:hypothetical protein